VNWVKFHTAGGDELFERRYEEKGCRKNRFEMLATSLEPGAAGGYPGVIARVKQDWTPGLEWQG
jgi:hypothetical protein